MSFVEFLLTTILVMANNEVQTVILSSWDVIILIHSNHKILEQINQFISYKKYTQNLHGLKEHLNL